MCGIAGLIRASGLKQKDFSSLEKMAGAIMHRGPDDKGIWCDVDTGVGLAHRRLSILDLSPQGHQPMISRRERFVISYNGEIYNYLAIKKELTKEFRDIEWRGHSDTEVLLTAIERWGIKNAVLRLNGMFAFAIWDKKEKILYLVRDRLGEKPLYYGEFNGVFLFGSELKALMQHDSWQGKINRSALALYLSYSSVPREYSIYQDIHKLLPATILSISLKGNNGSLKYKAEQYWSVGFAYESGINSSFEGTESDAVKELDVLLKDAITMRMHSDVPLGAFLSGGIDSSLIVALMQSLSEKQVRTFSIGFKEEAYDEAQYARKVAKYLATDHTEYYVTSKEAFDVIPELPTVFDEPFADSSQIPTLLVSRLAKQKVTVTLSGDGGDELFCGYNRYHLGRKVWKNIRWIHPTLRKLGSTLISSISPESWDLLFSFKHRNELKRQLITHFGDKIHKLADILDSKSSDDLYRRLMTFWHNPCAIVNESDKLFDIYSDSNLPYSFSDFAIRAMYLDQQGYLPDDILVKVDRASMAVGLESRIPLLDHRIVEFAWSLPLNMKIRDAGGKWILKQLLYSYVPKELLERPKMGFGVPIGTWLRGPLYSWANELLNENKLRSDGIFEPEQIRRKWKEHITGSRNWSYHLWNILMFQAWYHKTV